MQSRVEGTMLSISFPGAATNLCSTLPELTNCKIIKEIDLFGKLGEELII